MVSKVKEDAEILAKWKEIETTRITIKGHNGNLEIALGGLQACIADFERQFADAQMFCEIPEPIAAKMILCTIKKYADYISEECDKTISG